MSQTSAYETIMILSVKDGEEAAAALFEKFRSLIENGSTLESVDDWGKRRLAYTIMDETEGHYWLVNFSGNHDFPAELDRVYKITDGVLRSLIIAK